MAVAAINPSALQSASRDNLSPSPVPDANNSPSAPVSSLQTGMDKLTNQPVSPVLLARGGTSIGGGTRPIRMPYRPPSGSNNIVPFTRGAAGAPAVTDTQARQAQRTLGSNNLRWGTSGSMIGATAPSGRTFYTGVVPGADLLGWVGKYYSDKISYSKSPDDVLFGDYTVGDYRDLQAADQYRRDVQG
jgi:hypothetical protein